ncbi:MAG: GNAT family N-acetyltransferase [Candidatus Lokiarchaeota archaeon]|nr:GNAT family N-acetyltransferase [Candidatus Lokiarchaeota archaeon]
MQTSKYMPFIIGARVSLQPFSQDDAPLLVKWGNDPTSRQMARNTFPRTFDGTKKQLEEAATSMPKNDMIWMAIWHNADAKVIGEAKFVRIEWTNRNAMLWVSIGDTTYWHQRLGRDAIMLMLQYAFEELAMHKVVAHVILDNTGAVSAFTDCGFSIEVTFKDHVYFDYKYHDVGAFAIFEGDWWKRKAATRGESPSVKVGGP